MNVFETPYGCHKLGDPHKINGYYYEDPFYEELCVKPLDSYKWVPGVPLYKMQFLDMPEVFVGDSWAYGPNLMEHTAMYHELSLDGYVDGVAVPFCSEIGQSVWLFKDGWTGPYLVVDCAGQLDLYNVVVHRNESVEVGFQTALDWGMASVSGGVGEHNRMKVTWNYRRIDNVIVSFTKPTELKLQELSPRDLDEWFTDRDYYFETQNEWDNAYRPLCKTIGGEVMWKFSKEESYASIK